MCGLGVLAAWWVGLLGMGGKFSAVVFGMVPLQAGCNLGANVAVWWHRRGGVING